MPSTAIHPDPGPPAYEVRTDGDGWQEWVGCSPRTSNGKDRHTASYRDASGRVRSTGTFATKKEALDAIKCQEVTLGDGPWIDPAAGRITFADYAMNVWLPSRHIEISTRAGYVSNLRSHFVPCFGQMPLNRIMPSTVQSWVTHAVEIGLAPRSISKYHTMLHSIFARAVRDRLIAFNPCAATELPKIVLRKGRIITPAEGTRTSSMDCSTMQSCSAKAILTVATTPQCATTSFRNEGFLAGGPSSSSLTAEGRRGWPSSFAHSGRCGCPSWLSLTLIFSATRSTSSVHSKRWAAIGQQLSSSRAPLRTR